VVFHSGTYFCLTGLFFWRSLQIRPYPSPLYVFQRILGDYWCNTFYGLDAQQCHSAEGIGFSSQQAARKPTRWLPLTTVATLSQSHVEQAACLGRLLHRKVWISPPRIYFSLLSTKGCCININLCITSMHAATHTRSYCWAVLFYGNISPATPTALSLRFNSHFSRCTWVSRYQNVSMLDSLELTMIEVVVTTGAMYKAPVKSLPPTNQNPIIPSRSYSNEIFTGRLPFSTPKQQHQNTEGKYRLLWRTMARYQPWFTAHCVRLKITHKTLHINFCIMTGNIRYQRTYGGGAAYFYCGHVTQFQPIGLRCFWW